MLVSLPRFRGALAACLLLVGLGGGDPALAAPRTLAPPPGDDAAAWARAAALAGLRTVPSGADVTVVPGDDAWRLRVVVPGGATREVEVPRPRTQADREDLLMLALSLAAAIERGELSSAPPALPAPAVSTPAVASPRPPAGPRPAAPPEVEGSAAAPPAVSPLVAPPAPTPSPPAAAVATEPVVVPPPAASETIAAPAPDAGPSSAWLSPGQPGRVEWRAGLSLGSPTVAQALGGLDAGVGVRVATGLRLGGGVGVETPSSLAPIGPVASTTRLRASLALALELVPPATARVGLGAASHIFMDDGAVVGAVWSPLAEARVGVNVRVGHRWRLEPGLGLSTELLRIEAARDAASARLAPVTFWAGVEVGYSP